MYSKLSDKKIILSLNKAPEFEEFLSVIKVTKGTYAAGILWGIYRNIFVYSSELRSEYKRYYSVEYTSFEEYLFKKVGIQVKDLKFDLKYVFLFKPSHLLIDEMFDDNYLDDVLNVLGGEFEN